MKLSNQMYKKLSSSNIYRNPFFGVREDEVIKPDGNRGKFYVIEMPSSVMIVPLTLKREVYLIGMYRYPTDMYSWEIPGGAIENNDVLESAKKELEEETGLTSTEFENFGIYQAMNGSCNKVGHVVVAKNVDEKHIKIQTEEAITQLKKVTLLEVTEMIKRGDITDSHTISALTLVGLILGILK